MKKSFKIPLIVLAILIATIFLTRAFSSKQLDDITPGIQCDQKLLEKSDILFVIPNFEGNNISANKTWCDQILALNKTLAMHGVVHTYQEFAEYRNESYVEEGAQIFQECFGFYPTEFKPPQVAWTNENDWMKEKFKIDLSLNQLFHKTYHCNDTGIFPNWLVDIF